MKRRIRVSSVALEDIQRSAEDIYIYGYPLLLMDLLRRTQTLAASESSPHIVPANQFAHARYLPGPLDRRAPHLNCDCLSSSAWIDLNNEPVIITIPRMQRYYVFSIFSEWYEIFCAITPRNIGTPGGHFGLVAPSWSGQLPPGVKRIPSPTGFAWIDGLCAVSCAEDIQLAHQVQDQLQLTRLSAWGLPQAAQSVPFRLKIDHRAKAQEQIAALDASAFYTQLATLMRRDQPKASDGELLAECARIGFFPGEEFDFDMLPADTIEAMNRAVPAAQLKIIEAERDADHSEGGGRWSAHCHAGLYHSDYLARAVVAYKGCDNVLAEDITCFHTAVDDCGEPLKGSNRYVIHLPENRLPPVHAFWSFTVYDRSQHLVLNNIQRYSIGSRDRLKHNSDNSLFVQIQHEWPGPSEDSNWLPAPKELFSLALKTYWPKAEILTGAWRPPAVTRVN